MATAPLLQLLCKHFELLAASSMLKARVPGSFCMLAYIAYAPQGPCRCAAEQLIAISTARHQLHHSPVSAYQWLSRRAACTVAAQWQKASSHLLALSSSKKARTDPHSGINWLLARSATRTEGLLRSIQGLLAQHSMC